MFLIPSPTGTDRKLMIIASDGLGWEHVSVHATKKNSPILTPYWDEMNYIKELFWFDISIHNRHNRIATNILDGAGFQLAAWIALHEEHEKEYVWFIYEAAHVALGRCKADHQEWIEKVEALYNKLQQTGHL
ncbi:MAG TPA: hypothetical protein PLL95_03915 [Anaerolineales bacterium]|nr:hypothetical protein [Anaerolineales bacterium]